MNFQTQGALQIIKSSKDVCMMQYSKNLEKKFNVVFQKIKFLKYFKEQIFQGSLN